MAAPFTVIDDKKSMYHELKGIKAEVENLPGPTIG